MRREITCCDDNPLTEFSTNGMLCMLTTCLHFVGTSEESIRGEYHPFLEDSDYY